jgi:hypothetical protein
VGKRKYGKTVVWLVSTDDGWEALYIDGKAVYQNHRISIRDFMSCLDEYGLTKDFYFKDGVVAGDEANAQCEDLGQLPDEFADIEDCVQ